MIAARRTADHGRGAAAKHRGRGAIFVVALLTLTALAVGGTAPAGATPPAPSLNSPAVAGVSAATTAFTVTWSAAPPATGVTWDVQYRDVVAGTPTDADWRWLARGTRLTQKQAKGEPGHTYTLRARALQDGAPGAWSAEVSTVVPFDQEAGELFTAAFSSGWRSARASTSYLGSARYASGKGRAATYTFTGRALSLLTQKGPAKGKVQVKVRTQTSGVWSSWTTVKTLDLYSRTTKNRSLAALTTWPDTATRQAQFLVTGAKNRRSKGTRVDLDGIVVRDAPHETKPVVVAITPTQPTIGFEEQQQFTAEVRNSLDQSVEWQCFRFGDSAGDWLTDGAGSITSTGLYTSTDVPSQDTVGAGTLRRYLVQAVCETDPAAPYGTYNTFVTVVPGPAPEVTSLSASSGDVGTTITLHGTGFVNHSWQPTVRFGASDATIVGTPTATQISVRVPSGWYTSGTTASCYIGVTTCGQTSNGGAFTVTGLLPAPPHISSVGNQDGLYDCSTASPGDTLTVYGEGFSHTASKNVFDFGGQTATGTSWTDATGTTPERVVVTIPVTAPVGATMRVKCTDGNGEWSASPSFTVAAKTVVTLNASSFSHLIDPAGINQFASPGAADTWILSGSGFNSLRSRNSNYRTGTFAVEITAGGRTLSAEAWALSDTVAVCPASTSTGTVWGVVGAGDTVSVRVAGMELLNGFTRWSNSLSVQVAAEAVFGGVHHVGTPLASGTLELSKGDMLQIDGPNTGQNNIVAPGFWTGALPMSGWYTGKLLHFTAAGTYTVSDTTAGTTLTVVVKEGGAADEQSMWWTADDHTHPWWTEDFVMAGGGARVTIPAGTLVPEANYLDYRIGIRKAPSGVTGFDPTLGGFGGHYTIQLYAKRLYHPITVTLPYDPAGRFGEPGISIFDAASGVYYRLGGTVDSTDHTVTYTIPAGIYPATVAAAKGSSAASPPAAPEQAARGAAPWTGAQPLPALPIDKLLDGTAVVSSTVLPGVLVDEARRIRVEYCAEPASSSYVSAAYASEVLAVAQNTYANLEGHAWAPPTDWVVVHVRDFGPISPSRGIGTQGATTKAVFGQPYVYVNSQCTVGTQLDTAVSHEMGHVFERQLTTNIATKWIDEAVAEWVAFDTLGSGADLRASIEQGNDFAALQVPTGFTLGYSAEQAYAAGAFVIWMAQKYGPASVLSIYDQLSYNPDKWYSTYAVLTTATNATMADLVGGFGAVYWTQAYDPLKSLALASANVEKLTTDWKGVTNTAVRPPYSSFRVSVGATDNFKDGLTGSDLYVSATGLVGLQTIEIYGDTAAAQSPPGAALVKIGTLTPTSPNKFIGKYGSYVSYRFVELNCAALTAATFGLTVEPVRVDSVSPLTAPAAGGGGVTLSGRGFGSVKGSVTVGATTVQNTAITTWTDTSIAFKLPNMTGQTGPQSVVVHPAAGVQSNTMTLTLN